MMGVMWETRKPGGKFVRATVTSFKGSPPYLDLREWYADSTGELKPGKGCTVPIDCVAELHMALGRWLSDRQH